MFHTTGRFLKLLKGLALAITKLLDLESMNSMFNERNLQDLNPPVNYILKNNNLI